MPHLFTLGFSMPIISSIASLNTTTIDDAQKKGALPLSAVQRLSSRDTDREVDSETDSAIAGKLEGGLGGETVIDSAPVLMKNAELSSSSETSPENRTEENTNDKIETPTTAPVNQSSVDSLKEGIRRKLGQLSSQADALLQRVVMATPEQLEGLASELQRLAVELKRLLAQYKAIKEFSLPSFSSDQSSSEGSSNTGLNNNSVSTNAESASTNQSSSQSTDQRVNEAMNAVAEVSAALDTAQLDISSANTGSTSISSTSEEAIKTYERIDAFATEEQLNTEHTSASQSSTDESDGLVGLFKKTYDKLVQVKDLIEQKAYASKTHDSLQDELNNLDITLQSLDAEISGLHSAQLTVLID